MLFDKSRKIAEELHRLLFLERLAGTRVPIFWRSSLLFVFSLTLATLLTVLLISNGVKNEAAFMAGIFVLAALLWMTEALSLFSTALLVMGLEVILLANPGNWKHLGFESGVNPEYQLFLAPMADPIIFLFLGGFILALASVKEGIDQSLASNLLKVFGTQPKMLLLGIMGITACFSMWMSNTATTAMMITLALPIINQFPEGSSFRKALLIGVPFAANIGGMGTPIASPPNAVAVAFLRSSGMEVSFLEWMIVAVPFMLLMLFLVWGLLLFLFKPDPAGQPVIAPTFRIDGRGYFVMVIFSATIILWLSDQWHGLPTAVVGMLPLVAFTATGIISRSDISNIEWHILILIAGGIALGKGIQLTGLDSLAMSVLPAEGPFIFTLLVLATFVLSTFMSNTAAANLVIPLGISLSMSSGENIGLTGLAIALTASLSMSLPISTPPNAIAYAKGMLNTGDFVKAGLITGIIGIGLILALKLIIDYFSIPIF